MPNITADTPLAVAGLRERLRNGPKIEMVEYRRGHWYRVSGHPNPDEKHGMWPSVTGILSAGVPKPGLVGWAKNSTLYAVRAALMADDTRNNTPYEIWVEDILARAKATEDTEARDYGTAAHGLISAYVTAGTEPEPGALGYEGYRAFRNWLRGSGQTVAASEFPVFHEGIAGTVDLLLYDGYGTWTLADIKTGAGAYSDHAFQIAAYQYAASKMLDIPIRQGMVLHLPKAPKEGEPPFVAYQVKDSTAALVGYHAAAAMRLALALKHLEPLAQE